MVVKPRQRWLNRFSESRKGAYRVTSQNPPRTPPQRPPRRQSMNKLFGRALIAAATIALGTSAWAADKNWTAPAHKIYGQKLSDDTMAKHPELLSVTLHGTPPGMNEVYTMFAGSFPDRIGNGDDPDD